LKKKIETPTIPKTTPKELTNNKLDDGDGDEIDDETEKEAQLSDDQYIEDFYDDGNQA